MDSISVAKNKPHAVCVPLPFQSHINAMLKVAKLLHFKGFHITFVNTEFNHQRILLSRGPDSLNGLPDFQFQTIPDGLPPPSVFTASQDILLLLDSITTTGLSQVRSLITKLNEVSTCSDNPPVSCIVSDLLMTCTIEAAEEFAIPQVIFSPMNASNLMTLLHSQRIAKEDFFPLTEKSCLTNGYLHKPVDFIPGLRDFRVRDLWSFFWDGNESLQTVVDREVQKVIKASAIIFNTFDDLESEVLEEMKSLPPITYAIGPLHFLEQQISNKQLTSFASNLLEENRDCLTWLDSRKPDSVIYVNFGSTTVMTEKQLIEFAWGLANCKHPFLWVIRPDLVIGADAILPAEFVEETAGRSMISGWCPQEEVLRHSSTGGFLTHGGWNSIMDAMCAGVPIICWPFFGDQQSNCRQACVHWGISMEIDSDVNREGVEELVKEMMEGEKGKEMKIKSMEWKKKAEESTKSGGSSYVNLERIVNQV